MRIVREPFDRPPEKQADEERARRLEWVSIAFLLSASVVMYLVMGGSQAMKTAWVEDVLSLIPPIAVLLASRAADRRPTDAFPYGYARSMSIAFLVAATALASIGLFLVYDSSMTLIHAEHPTIGQLEVLGMRVWAGWVMIAALTYTVVGPVILGRLKLPLARSLHNKALHADAATNKADWMTGSAGIAGILGVGLGWWWADSVAALVISLSIAHDGVSHLRDAGADLMDRRPTSLDRSEPLGIETTIVEYLEGLSWVEAAGVRLREEGEGLVGEAFVDPADGRVSAAQADEATSGIHDLDWRLYDVVISPTRRLDSDG